MTMEFRMIDGVRRLTTAAVARHLLETGWTKSTSANSRTVPYDGPLDVYGNPIVVVVPANKALVEADRRITDVIRAVAALESRSPESLVEAIAKSRNRRRVVSARSHHKTSGRLRDRGENQAAL